MPRVNPEILRWARETAGLTLEEAATKIQLGPARGISGTDRLAALESLEEAAELPSRALLVRMSKQYRRPLLTFYLSRPPQRGDRGLDFRLLPGSTPHEDEALLDALIRNVTSRQSMVRSVLEDEDEAEVLPFVGSMTVSDGVPAMVASIVETLKVSGDDLREKADRETLFAVLRDHVESVGIFVLLIGDLGSHHSRVAPEVFRGYAIADDVAPFVVINDQDSRAAWAFTLVHELAHIWLGQTGVSGPVVDIGGERFCNDVASQFLLSEEALRQFEIPRGTPLEAAVREFADEMNLSRSMIAYRLYRAGLIPKTQWQELRESFRQSWFQSVDDQRALAKDSQGGPNYYVVRGHRTGHALLDLVGRMVTSGALTTSKAGLVLGVKPTQVPKMLRPVKGRVSRRTA